MVKFVALVLSMLLYSANSACDNDCSGHGECDCGFCQCHDNWGVGEAHDTGDCSDRVCPYELAHADHPYAGTRRNYRECSGNGICDRTRGECECFDGFEGKTCQRTTCPNDCSGNGRCRFLSEMSEGATERDFGHPSYTKSPPFWEYAGYDLKFLRGCHCDAEYIGADCSQRMCPFSRDAMDRKLNQLRDDNINVQRISITHEGDINLVNGKTFALVFRSRLNETYMTIPIVFTPSEPGTMATHIRDALISLPRQVVSDIQVHADDNYVAGSGTPDTFVANITFIGEGNQGFQNLIQIENVYCQEGCTPRLTGLDLYPSAAQSANFIVNVTEIVAGDPGSFECGRRGKCDYETGVCECFSGFTGEYCGICTNLI
mmetsp:Transcript_24648/g.41665  ORF Transcript_24648/g.41665 Transcript_24648/m.41665 type:complete len:374 (+) Transcript_24648:109-1230(+)